MNLENVQMSIRRHVHEPSWFSAFIYCLKVGDEESAGLIRQRNTPRSDECEDGEHNDCHSEFCSCSHHQFEVPPLESAPLRSCAEVQSINEELEAINS